MRLQPYYCYTNLKAGWEIENKYSMVQAMWRQFTVSIFYKEIIAIK